MTAFPFLLHTIWKRKTKTKKRIHIKWEQNTRIHACNKRNKNEQRNRAKKYKNERKEKRTKSFCKVINVRMQANECLPCFLLNSIFHFRFFFVWFYFCTLFSFYFGIFLVGAQIAIQKDIVSKIKRKRRRRISVQWEHVHVVGLATC